MLDSKELTMSSAVVFSEKYVCANLTKAFSCLRFERLSDKQEKITDRC